jgi:hypothetical protein
MNAKKSPKQNQGAGVEEHQNKEGSEIHSSANPFPLSRTKRQKNNSKR